MAVELQGAEAVLAGPRGRAAWKVTWKTLEKNERSSHWDGGTCGGLTVSGVSAVETARCSPDGYSLALLGENKQGPALFLHTGNDTWRVCQLDEPNSFQPQEGSRLEWSPSGDWIAFVGTLEPKPEPPDPLVITRIQYKTRTEFTDNRRRRVFVVAALPDAEPRALTPPEFDSHSISWIPGANEIVYASNREPDPDANHNYDLFVVNALTGKTRRLTRTPGVEMTPMASPDGKLIAYTATTRPVTTIDSVAEDRHVWVMPAAGGKPRELNPELDRRMTLVGWRPDSSAVLYLVYDQGKVTLWETEVASGASRALIDEKAWIHGASVASDGTIAFIRSDPVHLPEVYVWKPGASQPEKLSDFSRKQLEFYPIRLSQPETIRYKSFDGTEIQGWLYPPLGLDEGEKWPLILSVHGGPHGMYGYRFDATFQLLASRGYAVLALNPRGSTGYGQKFTDGCVDNWGGGDYKDLMAGIDYVLKRYPQIDPERLGVRGGSYGGFMTNWIITQTDRFRAAVSIASLSNLISFYATSLYQDLIHAEFGGAPWEGKNFEKLWRWSPLAHVEGVKTPVLFLHGEADNDVHITQAEEMYMAVRRQGVESVLVRYPREGHSIRELKHRADMLARTLEWFDRYLK